MSASWALGHVLQIADQLLLRFRILFLQASVALRFLRAAMAFRALAEFGVSFALLATEAPPLPFGPSGFAPRTGFAGAIFASPMLPMEISFSFQASTR